MCGHTWQDLDMWTAAVTQVFVAGPCQKDQLFALPSHLNCLVQGLAQGTANMRAQAQSITLLFYSHRAKGLLFKKEEVSLEGTMI